MLKIADATLLARSKIKSHKIWFMIVIVVEAILLAVVFLSLGVSNAIGDDLGRYSKSSLSGRYLVRTTTPRYTYNSPLNNNQEIWDLSEELYRNAIVEKKEIASQIGVDYDENSEEKPTEFVEGDRTFNSWTKYGQEAISEYINNLDIDSNKDDLRQKLTGYDYKNIYEWHNMRADGDIVLLKNGKEDFSEYKSASSSIDEKTLNGFQVLDESIYKEFILGDIDTTSESIPIVISQSAAKKYLGIEGEDISYNELTDRIINKEYDACYRNEASKQLLFAVEQSKNNSYADLVYAEPNIACGDVLVEKDNRSSLELENEAKNIAFQKATGEYDEPKQAKLTFRIVGVIPIKDSQNANSTDVMGLIQELGEINIATPLIPLSYYEQNWQTLDEVFIDYSKTKDIYGIASGYLIEFNDADDTIRFVSENTCVDNNEGCLDRSRPFYLSYDNKSLILTDISEFAKKIISIFVVIAICIAVITTVVIILRSINSERKEISIYGAIGFRRSHIVQIYLMQTIIVSVATILLAIVIALLIGDVANFALGGILATNLEEIFSIYNQTIETNVFAPNISILIISGVFVLSTVASGAITALLFSKQNIVSGLRYE